ncbi:hypothetical protein B2G88_17450 [Natronolimnobius baerhuensis]|uniref:Phage tail tape measure protein n=2 Tax=Natronolimnobius baerhuensis TaxID=253108 RepID=A0A202E4I0_9EURY|nr:hypothetical protein B2G88_17450 [Natronolimnobius baerhuensis]
MALDASSYVSEADDAADASEEVAGSTDTMSESLLDVEPAGIAAGGALAGLGTAAQGILDDTRETRESLDRTATTLGVTSDEARDLATSMSDATFPLDDVTESMDNLSGMVETPERMEEVATAADNVADATDSSASSITENLAPSVNALDGNLDALVENQDAFTLAARDTNMSIEDIGSTLSRLDFDQLEEMGLQSQEVAGLMSEFADETGYSGRQLESNFNSAVEEADGDLEELQDELGLGEDALDNWNERVEDAEGVTDDHAAAVSDNVSTMDRLRARMDDARLAASGYLGPMEALAPAAQAAGIGLMALSTVNVGAVAPSFATVAAAAAPVTAVILGVAAAGALLYAAWERDIGGIQDKTEAGVDIIMGGLERFADGIEWATETADYYLTEWSPGDALESAKNSILGPINDVREGVPNAIDRATDAAMDTLTRWDPRTTVGEKRDEIMGALPGVSDARNAAEGFVGGFTDGIRDKIPDVRGAVSDMTDAAGDYLPSSDAERGTLSDLTDMGRALPETAADGVDDGESAFAGAVDGMVAPVGDTANVGNNAQGSEQDFEDALERTDRTDDLLDKLDQLLRGIHALGDELNVDVTVDAENGRHYPF